MRTVRAPREQRCALNARSGVVHVSCRGAPLSRVRCRCIAWKLRRRALRYPLHGLSRRVGSLQPRTLTKTQAGQSSCAARAHRASALQRRKRLRASILAIALTAAVSNTTENRCERALEAFSQQQSQCIAQSSLRTAPPLLPHCACHCARQCARNERP